MSAARSRARDGLGNRIEFFVTTHGAPFWRWVQSRPRLRALFNRKLIDLAVAKMPPRPDPLSTLAPYTSWSSLTDRRYDGRHLPPAPAPAALPSAEQVAELFRRDGETIVCPKSTVLFAYFAQWFTDGFLRSDRTSLPKWSARRNESTHEIDLCQIYGVTAEATDELRLHAGGRLRSQHLDGEEFPPYFYRPDGTKAFEHVTVARENEVTDPARKRALFAIGTDTGNVQLGHVLLNVLFLREHNRIARALEREHPDWDDERLFQTARNVLIAILIRIVVEEYINHIAPYLFRFRLAGGRDFQRAKWFRTNRMSAEFDLLYRWHSLIPSELDVGGCRRPLDHTVFNPALAVEHGLGRLFEEASRQPAGRIGLFNTDPYLVEKAEAPSIVKARLVELASYNDYREHCGFPRVTAFEQISSDPRVRRGLRDRYRTVERIEFYPGLFAEDTRPNSVLPSLMGRMVGIDAFSQALTNPLLAPRVFNEATFSPLGCKLIDTTRNLSDVLHRNVPPRPGGYRVTMTRADWRRC